MSILRNLSPSQLVALSFLLAILVGTGLLLLPSMHTGVEKIGLLEALFTATSAICVTGLIVVDTGTAFTRLGQTVIMLLFQVGGLGILTLGVILAVLSGRRIGFSERMRLQTQMNALQLGGLLKLLQVMLLTVIFAEVIGATVLYSQFVTLEGRFEGIFYAIFHSISAFNNAGFALYSDSLMGFTTNPIVSLTIMLLIVLGGLGFFVVSDLISRLGLENRQTLSLHTKLALLSTLSLITLGFLFTLALEWNNPATLKPLSVGGKVLAALFQSVTARTAGFNTLDYGAMLLPTILISLPLMFIGANPGSTGGGIKTVTAFVLFASIWSTIRQKGNLVLFGRQIAMVIVIRALVIALAAILIIGGAIFVLTLTDADIPLIALMFEAISAFATVGLSLGITAELSSAGKLVIIFLMFLGRVGLFTLAVALVQKHANRAIHYPKEEIIIG